MLVTSLCWWLYDGDWFQMLVAESLCWQLFSLCWWFSQCIKSVITISNLSPTPLVSNIRHQHRCNHYLRFVVHKLWRSVVPEHKHISDKDQLTQSKYGYQSIPIVSIVIYNLCNLYSRENYILLTLRIWIYAFWINWWFMNNCLSALIFHRESSHCMLELHQF